MKHFRWTDNRKIVRTLSLSYLYKNEHVYHLQIISCYLKKKLLFYCFFKKQSTRLIDKDAHRETLRVLENKLSGVAHAQTETDPLQNSEVKSLETERRKVVSEPIKQAGKLIIVLSEHNNSMWMKDEITKFFGCFFP